MKPLRPLSQQKLVISASRRTDLPAFFGEWFQNRLLAGFCRVRNPFNPRQISRLELSPETVEAFVFWTRNPQPFLPVLDCLDQLGFRYVFLMTITGYPRELERNTPEVEAQIDALQQLSERIGPDRLAWRYDPVLLSNHTDLAWHLQNLDRLVSRVRGHVHHLIISLADFYQKTERHLKELEPHGWEFNREPETKPGFSRFLADLSQCAAEAHLPLYSCCEASPLFPEAGIKSGSCIDPQWLNEVCHLPLPIDIRDKGQRPHCRCAPSRDIGSSNTCRHGCLYCYATRSHDPGKQPSHDCHSEFL